MPMTSTRQPPRLADYSDTLADVGRARQTRSRAAVPGSRWTRAQRAPAGAGAAAAARPTLCEHHQVTMQACLPFHLI